MLMLPSMSDLLCIDQFTLAVTSVVLDVLSNTTSLFSPLLVHRQSTELLSTLEPSLKDSHGSSHL